MHLLQGSVNFFGLKRLAEILIHRVSNNWLNGFNYCSRVCGAICTKNGSKVIQYNLFHGQIIFLPNPIFIIDPQDWVFLLTIRSLLVKKWRISIAISYPQVPGSLVPHRVFYIKPTIKSLANFVDSLRIVLWVLFQGLQKFFMSFNLPFHMTKLHFVPCRESGLTAV